MIQDLVGSVAASMQAAQKWHNTGEGSNINAAAFTSARRWNELPSISPG